MKQSQKDRIRKAFEVTTDSVKQFGIALEKLKNKNEKEIRNHSKGRES